MLKKLSKSKILFAVCFATSLAACSSPSSTTASTDVGNNSNMNNIVDPTFTNTGSTFHTSANVQAPIYNGYSQVQLETLNNTVYFAFDKYVPLSQYLALIQAQAQFMKDTGAKVLLQGYTDERGTPAYNMVLGSKRASNVAQLLISYGVNPANIRQISYGEERPAVLGHTEADYAKDRRVVFYYQF